MKKTIPRDVNVKSALRCVYTMAKTEPHLTRGQNVVSLQDACRCQIVDDVLETNVSEHRAKRFAVLGVQEGLFFTQVWSTKSIGKLIKHLRVATHEKDYK